jgi:alkylhydroperoxidase family enzyme
MLPNKLRLWLFDRLSVKTMRYVSAVPWSEATGLTKQLYEMIADDFFINGSLTSRSRVPTLLAAIWALGRESMLVDDQLDRTTKEAICAVLSDLNDCPYCGDMLVSLVHAGDQHDAASALFESRVSEIEDPLLRARLAWVEAVTSTARTDVPALPYSEAELPEVIGSMLGMADINRYSHVVMNGSPVDVGGLQGTALRLFGNELRATKRRSAEPGRSLPLLPPAELPDDLAWAAPNPRIADSIARWAAAVDRETAAVISPAVRRTVSESLSRWQNERMPISRSWVEPDLAGLEGEDRAIARLTIVLAKSPSQVSEDLAEPLVNGDEERFVRILSWASSVGARRFASIIAEQAAAQLPVASK